MCKLSDYAQVDFYGFAKGDFMSSGNRGTLQAENKMGTEPCGRLLAGMATPIIISMLVQALYNVVDSFFVARYNGDALTAISLAFPVQSLMIAVGVGTGVGINALVSRRLGEKDKHGADSIAVNGLFLAVVSWLLFTAITPFLRPFFDMFTTDGSVIDMAVTYTSICTVFSFGLFGQIVTERLVQSTGKTIYNMVIQGTGAIINIIMDPILIFGLFGFPELGIAGAAVATVAGQIIGMILGIFINKKANREIDISLKGFKPDLHAIGAIYKIGAPSIVMQSIGSFLTVGINAILADDAAIAVYGVYFKLQSFVFMPLFGITNGMVPIVAYNYGAKKKKRIIKTVIYSFFAALVLMTAGMIIFRSFPGQLIGIFADEEAQGKITKQILIEVGIPVLRTISLSFPFGAVGIVASSMFQAFGKSMYSLVLSLCRQILVILPLAYIYKKFFGLSALWYAFPSSEIVAMVVCFAGVYRIYKLFIKPLPDGEL